MKVLILVLAVLIAVPAMAEEKPTAYLKPPPYSPELVAKLLDRSDKNYDPLLACRILDKAAFDISAAAFKLSRILESGEHGLKPKPDLAEFWLGRVVN